MLSIKKREDLTAMVSREHGILSALEIWRLNLDAVF